MPRVRLTLPFVLLLTAGAVSSSVAGSTPTNDYRALHGQVHAAAFYASPLGSTPRATCAAGSRPETSTQGRAPAADYDSGRAAQGYTCNVTVISHYGVSGGFRVERYVDKAGHECAYYDSSTLLGKDVYRSDPGVYVMDMKDPAHPVRTTVLRTPAMLTPHESLRVNQARGLLVADAGSPMTQVGFLDVYDISKDCRAPAVQSVTPMALLGHESGFSPDGRTFWASTTFTNGLTAIDLTDPTLPTVLWHGTDWVVHGLSLSADGNRAYLANPVGTWVSSTTQGGGNMVVLDTSQVQRRVANPVVTALGSATWPEVTIPQNALPITVHGHRYVLEFDEFDANVFQYDPKENVGGVHIIDVADERKPRVVSRIRLAVHNADARAGAQKDDPGAQGVASGYSAHYCNVPRPVDPVIVACSMIGSGLRIFDIRDPLHPREVGYANFPAPKTSDPEVLAAAAFSSPAFVPRRREVWYTDNHTGFYVLRLNRAAWPS